MSRQERTVEERAAFDRWHAEWCPMSRGALPWKVGAEREGLCTGEEPWSPGWWGGERVGPGTKCLDVFFGKRP